jgi:hypothetical protein
MRQVWAENKTLGHATESSTGAALRRLTDSADSASGENMAAQATSERPSHSLDMFRKN